MNKPYTIGIVAGEMSGDLIGAKLIKKLKSSNPKLKFVGIGGNLMQKQGLNSIFEMKNLSIIGYAQVFSSILRLYNIFSNLKKQLVNKYKIDLFIGIDAPDFNLRLANKLKNQYKIYCIHYVSPSIWAWRPNRIYKIMHNTNAVFCIFPFELIIYHKYKFPALFVGNRLAEEIPVYSNSKQEKKYARQQFNLINSRKINYYGFLIGSRSSEIKNLTPIAIETSKIIKKNDKKAQIIIQAINKNIKQKIEKIILNEDRIKVILSDARAFTKACDYIIVKSGTVSLETALIKRPMIIIYKLSLINEFIAKFVKLISGFVGMVNILAKQELVPEVLRYNCTPSNIVKELFSLKNSLAKQKQQIKGFRKIHSQLLAKQDNFIKFIFSKLH